MSATKILWGSPLPPTRSGIADYAAEALPHLASLAEVAVLEPPDWEPPVAADWLAGLRRLPWDAAVPKGFVPLLHLGNNPYHLWIARRLRRFGGMVVLHDTVLHHLLVEEASADGDWQRFAEELGEVHGRGGSALAAARRWGYGGRLDPFLFPARAVYLRHASAVIVHTHRAELEVAAACPDLPVRRVPLAVAAPPAGDRQVWRARLGVQGDDLLLVHLGFLTAAKGLDVILRSLASLVAMGIGARLVVVGEGSEAGAFGTAVAAAGLAARVQVWGYASEEDLGGILAAADLGLVPRYPTAGETSAAALRFFAAGKPVAVAGYRQFLELPREAALRIAPGPAGVADLVRVASQLATDQRVREAAGAAARKAWSEGGHDPAQAVAALLAAVRGLKRDVA
ncbi:MAG TPA: glycosyltransferase [Thermoanaerobaculaceae bacterium]|nr:glycosyltransferase [Thermoanaerobaculaceae bacterium]